jgi:hypothetical protein
MSTVKTVNNQQHSSKDQQYKELCSVLRCVVFAPFEGVIIQEKETGNRTSQHSTLQFRSSRTDTELDSCYFSCPPGDQIPAVQLFIVVITTYPDHAAL